MTPEEAAEAAELIRQARPRFLYEQGAAEVWERGPLLLTLPALRDWYPTQLKEAVLLHRRAALCGACPCGALGVIEERSRTRSGDEQCITAEVVLTHAPTCQAGDDAIAMLANAAMLDELSE